ncbi:MAG: AI-2E family transporter [Actinobacteria bacterium]|nr:AI-2E family transporter [Actinomycetota bacterium]
MSEPEPTTPAMEPSLAPDPAPGVHPPPNPAAVSMLGTWTLTRPPRWFPRAVLYVLLGTGLFFVARSLFSSLSGLLILVLVSLFLSFAIEPAVDRLSARGMRRGAATGLVFVGLLVGSAVLVGVIVNLVIEQVSALVNDAPELIEDATSWFNSTFDANVTTDDLVAEVRQYEGDLTKYAGDVGGRVISVTGTALGVLFDLFTIALFTFYLVAEGPKFRRTILSVLPPDRQVTVLDLWEVAISKTGGYLYSRTILATVSAMISWVAFTAIGVPSPLALAVWMGIVSQFVPVVGTYIGGLLPVLIALTESPGRALAVFIFMMVYQQFENYVLAPRITARTMEIHPAVAFGAAIAGGSIIGPVGALLALPAAAIIQAFISSYLSRHELIEGELAERLVEQDAPEELNEQVVTTADGSLWVRLQRFGKRARRAQSSTSSRADDSHD